MRIDALMIGRGGSSLAGKNIMPVLGVPLLLWPAAAARRSQYIQRFFVSSDDDDILQTAARAGYRPIRRPAELASSAAQSCDVVRHGFAEIARDGAPDILVLQHANAPSVTEQMIDACIEMLVANPAASAVAPVHKHPEHHPLNAKFLAEDGTLIQALPGTSPSANRQDLPPCFFFDHTFWVLRAGAIDDPDGQPPWPCMGSRILPYETDGGVDIHVIGDMPRAEEWLRQNRIPPPSF